MVVQVIAGDVGDAEQRLMGDHAAEPAMPSAGNALTCGDPLDCLLRLTAASRRRLKRSELPMAVQCVDADSRERCLAGCRT